MAGQDNKNVVILDGDPYEVEVYLVKDCESGIVPISFSSIKYLEIINDLANIGYYGNIIFANFNNILEKLSVLKTSKNPSYMYFRFKSLSISNAKSTFDDIFLIAALTQGQDLKTNAIEGDSAYNFEELYTFKLKTTKVIRESNKYLNYNNQKLTINEIIKAILSFNELPKFNINFNVGLFSYNQSANKALGGEGMDSNISIVIEEVGTPLPNTYDNVALSQIVNLKSATTLFDALKSAYPYLCYEPHTKETENGDWYDPGMIKIENSTDELHKRKIVLFPLLTTIREFLNRTKPDYSKKTYYKNFLLDRFNIATDDGKKAPQLNTIEKYELNRVNYEEVQQEKWVTMRCNYEGSASGCYSNDIRKYSQSKSFFEKNCTSPYSSNLPDPINENEDKEVIDEEAHRDYSSSIPSRNLALAYGTNAVLKSFVFDNLAVTFRVKGQPYRKPNRFILINTPPTPKSLKNYEGKEIDGYWYVISVKHIFENNNYFNEFNCVKIYDPTAPIAEVSPEPAQADAPTTNGSVNGFEVDSGSVPSGGALIANSGLILPNIDGTYNDDEIMSEAEIAELVENTPEVLGGPSLTDEERREFSNND